MGHGRVEPGGVAAGDAWQVAHRPRHEDAVSILKNVGPLFRNVSLFSDTLPPCRPQTPPREQHWLARREGMVWASRIIAIGLSMFLPGVIGGWLDDRFGLRLLGPAGFSWDLPRPSTG